jgi:hypothetical protein
MLSTEPRGRYETNIAYAINRPEQLTSWSGAFPEKLIPYILRNPKFHYHIRNIPPKVFIRNLMNLVPNHPSNLFQDSI